MSPSNFYRDPVNQARTPVFYRKLGVPDTPEGRFEMVALHVVSLVRRRAPPARPGPRSLRSCST